MKGVFREHCLTLKNFQERFTKTIAYSSRTRNHTCACVCTHTHKVPLFSLTNSNFPPQLPRDNQRKESKLTYAFAIKPKYQTLGITSPLIKAKIESTQEEKTNINFTYIYAIKPKGLIKLNKNDRINKYPPLKSI